MPSDCLLGALVSAVSAVFAVAVLPALAVPAHPFGVLANATA